MKNILNKPKKEGNTFVESVHSNSTDSEEYITIQQIYSGAGKPKNQRATLIGLNLNKINKKSTLMNTVEIRGMINTVKHLIKIIK